MHLLTQTKALADETRLRLLGILARHELNVGEIVQVMGMGQSRISRHLKILMDAGFVVCKRDGLWAFYSTVANNGAGALLQAVLDGLSKMPEHALDLEGVTRVLSERRQSTTRFFDGLAADWTRMSQEILGNFDLARHLLGALQEFETVVDLGCGPGLLLGTLAEQAHHVIGVDNSARMLEAAGALLPENSRVSLRIGDLEHLPLRDGEADAAVMSLVLHHLASPGAGIVEMGRVVRPGGRAVLAEFQLHDNETLRSRYGDRWLGFSPDDLWRWLEQAGFRTQTCERHPINLGLTLIVITAKRHDISI